MPPMHQKRQWEETNSFVETFLHRGLTTQSHKVGIRYVQKHQGRLRPHFMTDTSEPVICGFDDTSSSFGTNLYSNRQPLFVVVFNQHSAQLRI